MRRTISKALAVGFLFTLTAWAEDDEPGRGVARLSLIYGDVSVRRGDSGDWVAASVNAPLVVEDHVLTGSGSRAEVQFDYANFLRLAADADVRLAALEQRRYQVQVARGTVMMRVLRNSDAEVEIDTPNVSVRPTKKGAYRIEVHDDGQTEVTVRSGETEVYTPRGVEKLHSGRTMLVRGTQSEPEYQIVDARREDDWDRWNEDRDRRLERSRSYAYVSRDIYGADELDYYGRWVDVPPYGYVWSPYGVAAGWAPYRHGRWVWVDWYGWTWVSYDPWGWAPYHYGRWFHSAPYGWCWFPGPVHQRHYWRPALVAFFGFHAGPVHVGFGFGRIGWVPLAPYEPFHPWYGRGIYGGFRNRTYVDNSVRIVNNVNITNVYRNARVRNGVSGIDSDGFARGRAPRAFEGQEIRVQRANLVQGAVPVTPTRESLRISDREVRVIGPGGRVREPQFFMRRQPARVERVSFEDQRHGMDTVVRRAFAQPGRGEQGSVAAGAMPRGAERGQEVAVPRGSERAVRTGQDNEGWRRIEPRRETRTENQPGNWRGIGGRTVSEPARQETAIEPQREPASGANWRRFGGRTESEPARQSMPGRQETAIEPQREQPQSGGNWRRFGGQTGESARPEDAWRRSSPTRSGGDEPRVREIPRSEPRNDWQRMSGPSRIERNEAPRFDRPAPVQINPPIVRERNASPRMERSGGNFGGSRSGAEMRGGGASRGGEMRSGGGRSGGDGGGSRGRGGRNR